MQTNKSGNKDIIKPIERATNWWNRGIAGLSSIFILAMMLLIVADVGGRYIFGKPIMGSVEVEGILLAYIGFLSLAYGLMKGAHVRVSLLLSRFPFGLKIFAEVLAGVLGILLFTLLIWGGIEQFWESWIVQETMPAAVKIPYWLPKLALPLGAFLMTVQLVIYIMRQFINAKSGKGDK